MDTLEQFKKMHEEGKFPGHSLVAHIPEIKHLISRWGFQDMLDYGCGKALFHPDWGIPCALYDPAHEPYSRKPDGRFDLVICTDVAEHIEEAKVDEFLEDLFSYAEKLLFISVCTRLASKVMPDGRNAHLTVKPKSWWLEKLLLHNTCKFEVRWNE